MSGRGVLSPDRKGRVYYRQDCTIAKFLDWFGLDYALGGDFLRILGIETSCDETGVAVYDSEKGLMAHELYSQVRLHADFGGVVPELASRDHVRKLVPLIKRVMKNSGSTRGDMDGIAYTSGPGLIGACLLYTSPSPRDRS